MSETAEREQLMVQAAKLYYDLDQTQADIADRLGVTRWQVGRLLREARDIGIVRIEIVPHAPRRPDLESALQRRLGLRDAIVVPGDQDAVARAAAGYLAGLKPRPPLIGVSWGRTMAALAQALPPRWNDGAEIVMLNGSTTIRAASARANTVAERLAETAGGTATILPVPAIVGAAATRSVLEQDPVIGAILARATAAPVACFGLGAIDGSVLVESGYLDQAAIAALKRAGAVGDILGRFVDGDGQIVDAALDARTIGLAPALLRVKPVVIGISAGPAKHAILRACTRAGYVNVVVTDEGSARHLLEETS